MTNEQMLECAKKLLAIAEKSAAGEPPVEEWDEANAELETRYGEEGGRQMVMASLRALVRELEA